MPIYMNALLLAHCWSVPVRCHYSRDSPVTASLEANHAGILELRSCCWYVCCFSHLISAEASFLQHVVVVVGRHLFYRSGLPLAT